MKKFTFDLIRSGSLKRLYTVVGSRYLNSVNAQFSVFALYFYGSLANYYTCSAIYEHSNFTNQHSWNIRSMGLNLFKTNFMYVNKKICVVFQPIRMTCGEVEHSEDTSIGSFIVESTLPTDGVRVED